MAGSGGVGAAEGKAPGHKSRHSLAGNLGKFASGIGRVGGGSGSGSKERDKERREREKEREGRR
jgi:hypothetical protein